jgi:cytochrome b
MKYTPGPWEAIQDDEGDWMVRGVPLFWIAQAIREAQPDTTGEANARLMAAAPELLEAAEAALRYLKTQMQHTPTDPHFALVVQALRAALAKGGSEYVREP